MKKKQSQAVFLHCVARKTLYAIFPVFMCAVFSGCLGVSMDITVRSDGSGVMALEYRVSKMAEALGKLDGNERWNTVPVGRADFERTMARLPGLRLTSFSSKDEGADLVTRAQIAFDNFDDLAAFLAPQQDTQKNRAVFTQENGTRTLFLLLSDASSAIDADLRSLYETLFSRYSLRFSLNVPAAATLRLTDAAGSSINAPHGTVQLIPRGKKVSFGMDMRELFNFTDGLALEFIW